MNKTLNEIMLECYDIAKSKGWHDKEPSEPNVSRTSELLLLLHSEISEACEELRKNPDYTFTYNEENGKPAGFKIELADLAIRLFDLCVLLGINLEKHITTKCEYNKSREYRHGNKTF